MEKKLIALCLLCAVELNSYGIVCSPGENGLLAEDELEPLVMAEYVSLEEPGQPEPHHHHPVLV
jgi:hypothetical protein